MTKRAEIDWPTLVIQRAATAAGLPGDEHLERWVRTGLADLEGGSVVLRLVDEAEGRELNQRWRGLDRATNVLSFPADVPADTGLKFLGDIVLCAPVVEREAREQGKPVEHHWAHLVIHGLLHLRGYDHMTEAQAGEMESREIELLATLGVPDPYRHDEH